MSGGVLVTGGTGFLGAALVRELLSRGRTVHLLLRDPAKAPATLQGQTGLILHQADLLSGTGLGAALEDAKAETLYHFAWHDDPATRWTAPANLDWVRATLALAQTFAASGGKHFIGAGSCAEYNWRGCRLNEIDTPLRPATLYGAAKAASFLALDRAQESLDLKVLWGRIFFCYGPDEPPGRLLSDLVARLTRGELFEATDGMQRRDYLHTGDIARAFADLGECGATGPVNVASGEALAVRELVIAAAERLGRTDLLKLGALPRRAGDPDCLVADVTRLRELIGFGPAFDLATGLAWLAPQASEREGPSS